MKSAIKLLKLNELECGTIRLQSQLLVGKNDADFVLENDVLKYYRLGVNGFVTRQEAYKIAFKADQIKGPNKGYALKGEFYPCTDVFEKSYEELK